MRSSNEKFRRDGKSANASGAKLSEIEIKSNHLLYKTDLIHQKCLSIISQMKSNNIVKKYEPKVYKDDGMPSHL